MKNLWLSFKSWYRYIFNKKSEGSYLPIQNNLTLEDDIKFQYINDNDLKERFDFGFNWGNFHKDKLITYFDNDCVQLGNNVYDQVNSKTLNLICKYKPKTFNEYDYDNLEIPFAQGVIRTKKKYKYGYFESEMKLPACSSAWPAFWLTGSINWPPEIDVIEGYSNNTTRYKWFLFPNTRLQTNVHYKDTSYHHIKGVNHPLPISVSKEYVKYGVLWLEDKIEFYYNRHLVRSITDKNILNALNEPMEVIFNMGIQDHKLQSSYMQMAVKSLKIWQY